MSEYAPALAADNGPWSQVRTGLVTEFTSTQVTVLVGGTRVTAAYLTQYTPATGQLVALLRQDASWLCLGQYAGTGTNLLQNPSFELSPPGVAPFLWQFADVSNTSGLSIVAGDAPEGEQYALVTTADATAVSYLYSSATAVTAGQYAVSAYVMGVYADGAPTTADAALVALWFASPADLYPATSSGDVVITTLADVNPGPPFTQISATLTVPSASFLRLALRSTLSAGQGLAWDLASMRRIG